jgi:hypothetical protein
MLTALWLTLAGMAWAADPVTAGNYKFSLVMQGQQPTLWLVKLESKDGKVTGQVVANHAKVPGAKLAEATIKDGVLRLNMDLKLDQPVRVSFEGKLPAEGKKIYGVFVQGAEMVPAQLELTTLTSLDNFEVSKDVLAQSTSGPEIFDAAMLVLSQAAAKKAKIEDVRNWANKAYKASEQYGTPWQREMALRMAKALAQSEEFAPVAVQYARQAERMLQLGDKVAIQQRTLNLLATALTKAGKADEAKEISAKLDKLSQEAVTPAKFAGRKGKSERVAVVELFTGAECPPCVAADLAFDALAKTFNAKDVVLLQYHLHIPGPDPLTNQDSVARRQYYRDDVDGTPKILFNGKLQDFEGGGFDEAQERYDEYVGALTPLLEKPAPVKLKASATQKGAKINISAEVAELAEPGDKVRLRLALVEEEVNYKGGNRLPHHHSVVRALPGGAAGLALKDKTGKQSVTVDLDDLRKKLNGYLDEAAKDMGDFPNKERPLELKKLKVVAFVQNDATKEILQAIQVPVVVE